MNNLSFTRMQILFEGQAFDLWECEGRETLNEPYSFTVRFYSPKFLSLFCLSQVTLQFFMVKEVFQRSIHGIVTSLKKSFSLYGYAYELKVEPKLCLLKHSKEACIYSEKNLNDLTALLLIKAGYFFKSSHLWLDNQKYPYYFQLPNENAFEFLIRHWANEGIFYGFSQEVLEEKINFSKSLQFCDTWFPEDENTITLFKNSPEFNSIIFQMKQLPLKTEESICFSSESLWIQVGKTVIVPTITGFETYLVTQIHHKGTQNPGNHGEGFSSSYVQEIQAMKKSIPFMPVMKNKMKPLMCMPGVLESSSSSSDVDEEGAYAWRYAFENTNSPSRKRISLLSTYGGKEKDFVFGCHHPLKPGEDVLIHYVEGDALKPFIAASLPSDSHPSPVTANSLEDNILRPFEGWQWKISENDSRQEISLTSPQQSLKFLSQEDNQVEIHTQGRIVGESSGNISWQCEGSLTNTVQGDFQRISKKEASFQCGSDVNFSLEGKVFCEAEYGLTCESGNVMNISAEKMDLFAKKNMNITGKQIQWHIKEGSLFIQSAGGHSISAESSHKIVLENRGSALTLENNIITLQSGLLAFTAEKGIFFQGKKISCYQQ